MSGWIAGALGAGAALGYVGARKSAKAQAAAAAQNAASQREFAQKGIQWRVADARAAGIHPLAALGANTMSFNPIAVGDTSSGSALSNLGQDVSRAAWAASNNSQRKIADEQLTNMNLQNEMLRTQITAEKAKLYGQTGPSMPGVEHQTSKRTLSPKGALHQQTGDIPYTGFAKTPTGLVPVPSTDAKERIEDQIIPEMKWAADNYVKPLWSERNKPSKQLLPKGAKDWQWSVRSMEWQPVYKRGKTPWKRWSDFVTDWQK